MKMFVAINLFCFLFSPLVFSQRADYIFKPNLEWVSLEKARDMDPDDVYHLKLKRNKSNTIPSEIYKYTNLKSLSISGMKLTALPEEILAFQKLTYIDFSKNKIESLPLSFCTLSSLEVIVANQNPLGYLPFCMGELMNLTALDLWDTEVTTLPESMEEVKTLEIVDFQGIELQLEEQEFIQKRFPWVKFRFDKPCNCFK